MARGGDSVSLWNLAANPIFRRYTGSRLRATALIPWMLVVAILATFIFLAVWVGGSRNGVDTVVIGPVAWPDRTI